MRRRDLLAAGFAASPLLAALGACGSDDGWPEGMQPIHWDRDTCERCRMVISDRRFAAQLMGGPKRQAFKFDDIGCAVFWLRDKAALFPWAAEPATRFWVADVFSRGQQAQWLDARSAHYLSKTSPMGYNFGATAHPQAGSVDFRSLGEHVLARGR
jgi:copper chaperone NosL